MTFDEVVPDKVILEALAHVCAVFEYKSKTAELS